MLSAHYVRNPFIATGNAQLDFDALNKMPMFRLLTVKNHHENSDIRAMAAKILNAKREAYR